MPKIYLVQSGVRPEGRESDLALAHVRTSSSIARVHPYLRKMAALIHREDAAGVIAQRVICSDPRTVEIVDGIIAAMWLDSDGPKPSLGGAIDLFGWPIVREVAVTCLLHQVNAELAGLAGLDQVVLDRMGLAIATAGAQLGCDVFSALLANVGIVGLAGIAGERYANLRRRVFSSAELTSAEQSEFGFSHAALGAAMLWEADFPDPICSAVLDHCNPASSLWLAELLAGEVGLGHGNDHVPAGALERHGISAQSLIRIKEGMTAAASLPNLHFAA